MSDSSTPSSLDILVSAACASEENDFSNFPQAVLVDPHEIQSNVNQKSTRQMEGSSTTPNKDLKKSQLFKTLKKVVAKQIAELKGMSTSKIDETTTNLQIVPSTSQETAQAKQTRSRTTLTGEFSVSFELPDDFPEDANVDTLVPEGSETDPPTSRQLSFSERLDGWRITQRKRVKGICDMYYRHERSNASLRSVVEVVRFILFEELPKQQYSANKGKLKGSAEKMTKWASVKRKSSDAGCSKNPPEENKEGLDGPPREKLVKLSPEAMEARVKAFLKAAYENLKNFKYFVSKEEKESDGAKTEEVKVSKEEGESIVAPSSLKVASPNVPCKVEEAPINPPTELDQPNPPTEMDQPNPAVNHEEVGHGNASQNYGNGGDIIYGLLVQASTPKLATMEDEGNLSLPPPSDIEIKKEQLEMLGEFDHKVVQPQEVKGTFEDEMWSGDSSAIKAVPIQAIPAQTAKVTIVDGSDYELPMGWLVEQRPRTSLKYLGKVDLYCHEVKTRKRFRSLKAAKNWIMEANQGEQAHEPLEAGDGSN